ncbi:MAG: hypothetical protein JXR64_06215 [Spirochaetales bacterium]|nr:hypothetical protein [Spirochaetales bacterium]
MIYEIFYTIFPSIIVLSLIVVVALFFGNVDKSILLKSFFAGIILVLPALLLIKALNIIISITLNSILPLAVISILSISIEELLKYLTIKKIKGDLILIPILVGGGFAISETLYYSIGYRELALYRSFTSLPIHIITSIILYVGIKKDNRIYILLSILIHFTYNYFIH